MDFRLFPLRDYEEDELMSLPADSRLLFADALHDGLLVYDQPSPVGPMGIRRRRVLLNRSSISQPQLTKALLRVRALRCLTHGISAFSLYPTTDQQYHVNRFLWQAANDSSFQAAEAASIFQRNVFIISMPSALFDFLTRVTWEQLEDAMLFTLASLATDEQGRQVLRDELAPALSEKLDQMFSPPSPDYCDPNAFRLMLDLVMDRIVWMGPWIVPTTLCYLSASDMAELLANRCDRPIFSSPEKFELVHTMMWNIYRDWQTYRHILVRLGGHSHAQALKLMARTISRGTQTLFDEGIRTLLQLTAEAHSGEAIPFQVSSVKTLPPLRRKPSRHTLFSLLPSDVIIGNLLPKLCEAYASDDKLIRRRTPGNASSANAPPEPAPTAIAFSLRNWVLEDFNLHEFYHIAEAIYDDFDDEMSDAEPTDIDPEEIPPNVEAGNAGSSLDQEEVGNMPDSPRTQRRRLNEQGTFEMISPHEHASQGTSSESIV